MQKRKIVAILLTFILVLGILPTNIVQAYETVSWEYAKNRVLDRLQGEISPSPIVGSVGGEWAILALARAGQITINDPLVHSWLVNLERILVDVDNLAQTHDIQNPSSAGTFPSALRRWTDFQRVTIAISALGLDASNFNGRDLTAIFSEFVPPNERHPINQTINADIYALIALDSWAYSGDRYQFLDNILNSQRADGTWSLNPNAATSSADISITAMAIQALAPYYATNSRVAEAVTTALGWLRTQTFADPEATTNMVVALTALGSDFAAEATYYVNHLLRWFDPVSGGFRRPTPNDPVNHMATEQAAYGLTAYWRFVNGMTPLYDMSDMFAEGAETLPPITDGLPGKHADVRRIDITIPERTFGDIGGHANQSAIETLASRGIISGRSDNIFDPAATMTRAEFAAITTRALGLPSRPNATFADVPTDAWFAEAVGTAFYYEIINGTSPTTFNPNGTITRQEAAVMVARASRLTGMNTNLSDVETLNILAMFGDYRRAANWAWSSLAFCYREGILDDTEFYIQPLAAITRGEIAEMVYRMLERANLL